MIPKHSHSPPIVGSVYCVVLFGREEVWRVKRWNGKITYAITDHNKTYSQSVCGTLLKQE
jgi:hypothetical protein